MPLAFYRDLLGFTEVGSWPGKAAALTSGRTHHEILLIKVEDSLDELRGACDDLAAAGIPINGMSDHTVTQGLYLRDPDGNEVDLYVAGDPAIWRDDPAAVMTAIKPLVL